jgi:dsRNA-specific ribonuclease
LNANGSGSATSTSAASSGSSSHLPVNSIDAVAAANAAAQASALTHANPIGAVNEFHQKRGLRMPAYHDAGRTSGPDHEPSFLATVTLYDGRTFEARGTSKKDAKTNVALKVANALGLALRP